MLLCGSEAKIGIYKVEITLNVVIFKAKYSQFKRLNIGQNPTK